SPYVWLPKRLLPVLPAKVFDSEGALRPEVAKVLCLDANAQHALNEKLANILGEYRALELKNAERTEEHLPGIENGQTVTIQVPALEKEAGELKQQFNAAIREAFGQQRADFIFQRTDGWFDSTRNQFAQEPKTISVVRHPNGTYNVSVKCGNSWLSTGGAIELNHYIPAHLLPIFQEALQPQQLASPAE
ncbi:MAG TPA: hypothetical protein VEC99_13620, partial [Clostridia bacterium]|nr:hypothetical protein [Clostridia bacterium]